MNLHELKGHRDLVSMHKTICKSCGLCCHIKPIIAIENLRFIPVAEKLEGLNEADREYLGLYVCEHLDTETKQCKIYDDRPVECRKFMCKGNPKAQVIHVQGEGIGRKN